MPLTDIDGQRLGDSVADKLGNRNLIINGAMQVAQRGTVVNAGNEYGGPDRFRFAKNDGAFTISQSTDVPSGQGFSNSWKADVTSVSGTAGAYLVAFQHRFEGQNLQHLKKGSSSAESVTLQFWIKSSKTGTYIAELFDADNTRQISKSYTVSSADTWEHKTITFPGDTSGTLDNDNARSLELNLWLFAGSTYSSGTLSTTWTSSTNANRAVGQVNAGDDTANNIYITGVQLEVGNTATPFEHRSYGDELARCQRYYQQINGTSLYTLYGVGRAESTTNARIVINLRTTMRSVPTFNSSGTFTTSPGGTVSGMSVTHSTADAVQLSVTNTSLVSGSVATLNANNDDDTNLQFSAEI